MIDFFERYGHLIIPEPNTGCHIWLGALHSAGYGQINRDGKVLYVHRCSYECVHGVGSLDGLMGRHRCDFPPCCNPDHILKGTQLDNMHDMIRRGRARKSPLRGESNPAAFLTDDQVRDIHRKLRAGVRQIPLAAEFGVSQSLISGIKNGINWPHLKDS